MQYKKLRTSVALLKSSKIIPQCIKFDDESRDRQICLKIQLFKIEKNLFLHKFIKN